jgi:Arc/MetJ-type ribon-helix-helix transcriptional regulator
MLMLLLLLLLLLMLMLMLSKLSINIINNMYLKNPFFQKINKQISDEKSKDMNRTRTIKTRTILSISMPPEMARELKYLAFQNRFSSISEFIRYTVRLFTEYEVENVLKESIIEKNLRRNRAHRSLAKSFRELEIRGNEIP